jgi:hypothetical protein
MAVEKLVGPTHQPHEFIDFGRMPIFAGIPDEVIHGMKRRSSGPGCIFENFGKFTRGRGQFELRCTVIETTIENPPSDRT